MLPWESMPVLKYEEVYRMPSVANILYSYEICRHIQNKGVHHSVFFPMITIDPLDAFYLANPSRDLPKIDKVFSRWFENYKLKVSMITFIMSIMNMIMNKT